MNSPRALPVTLRETTMAHSTDNLGRLRRLLSEPGSADAAIAELLEAFRLSRCDAGALARYLGFSRRTLFRMLHDHPRLERELAAARVEAKLAGVPQHGVALPSAREIELEKDKELLLELVKRLRPSVRSMSDARAMHSRELGR